MRCFVAVMPPDRVVEELDSFLAPRRLALPEWRWADPYQWHITCAFCPDVADGDLDPFEDALAAAAARRRPMTLRLTGGGAFPNAAAAKTFWVAPHGSDDDLQELDRLATGARNAAAVAGTTVEGGPFTPHVTLARLGRAADVTRMIGVLDSYVGSTWTAQRVALVASHLGEGRGRRPRYEILAEFEFGDATVDAR